MRKMTAAILAALIFALILTSCAAGPKSPGRESQDKIKIVSTIFPQYDWMREILGDRAQNAELTLLLDSGVDLHSYQPTADDIIKISTCDLFIYVGGESDKWVKEALETAVNKDMVVINLLEALGDLAKEEEIKEGMEHEHEHEHDDEHDDEHEHEHDDDHDDGHSDEAEIDEHVWLSLKNAKVLVAHLAQKLGEIDAENADGYETNAKSYIDRLDALDKAYAQAVNGGKYRTLLFADRFPFRYLADDYSLDYYAAFAGCSAETEASFETIVFLANKADELSLKNILVIEGSDQSIAKTVIENTKDKSRGIAVLDSMQSVTEADVKAGVTYLSIMEKNLAALKNVLN